MSQITNNIAELVNFPGDGPRLFEVSQPHLRNMLKRAGVCPQDYDDLIQEAYLGFLHFLQKPQDEINSSDSLLPVLIDIMKKRISDYRGRKKWKQQSVGGTDAQVKMAGVSEPRPRDTVIEAKSTWARHPYLEEQALQKLQKEMEPDAYYIVSRRREDNPPTLRELAEEMKISIGKTHKLETQGNAAFQAEFKKLLDLAIDKPR